MGHELCLYRSNAVRQGTVVLLLKISMVLMKKLMACSRTARPLLLFYCKWLNAAGNWYQTSALAASLSQQALFRPP
jgi:hypothetical protein